MEIPRPSGKRGPAAKTKKPVGRPKASSVGRGESGEQSATERVLDRMHAAIVAGV